MAAPRREFATTPRPGVTAEPDGAVFCLHAPEADAVWLCLFGTLDAPDDIGVRHELRRVGGGHWAVRVPRVGAGTRYGYRARGPWAPREGLRFNEHKLLVDPYARALDGELTWVPEVFAHHVDAAFDGDDAVMDTRDSAPFVPRGVVVDESFDWGGDEHVRPRTPLAESVIYEAHVRGFTMRNPEVPEALRGTYAGLAHPASVAHLHTLGVTAVELLPVQAFVDEPHLVKLGLSNYWGYNTLGFFAPHGAYAATSRADEVGRELKSTVKTLHAAGLEVILDVVYNHTCEQGGHEGATLSLRGLDNRGAYRLDGQGRDLDVTGCGNSLDLRDPATMRLVLDSLRHWVGEYHVDGFRFDLAVTLGRGPGDGFDARSALLMAVQADPVLREVKLIAEPWDIGPGGWRTGQFPHPFAEWNDRFRGTVRGFWLDDVRRLTHGEGAGGGVADLATRLAGSRDLFGGHRRGPEASINYVTAHDGFPLADLTAYEHKHNEANGEDNRDGTNDNRSWNHGVEGPSDDPGVVRARMRSMRNVLGTLLLSAGVPMLTAGDEFGRTQGGNNNAYCQDSPLSWLDWDLSPRQRDLLTTTRHLVALRRRFAALRAAGAGEGATGVQWFGIDGAPMTHDAWQDPSARTLQALFEVGGADDESVLLVLHGSPADAEVTLPPAGGGGWQVLWDSAEPAPPAAAEPMPCGASRPVSPLSMLVLGPVAL